MKFWRWGIWGQEISRPPNSFFGVSTVLAISLLGIAATEGTSTEKAAMCYAGGAVTLAYLFALFCRYHRNLALKETLGDARSVFMIAGVGSLIMAAPAMGMGLLTIGAVLWLSGILLVAVGRGLRSYAHKIVSWTSRGTPQNDVQV